MEHAKSFNAALSNQVKKKNLNTLQTLMFLYGFSLCSRCILTEATVLPH